jgi:hypothetical protein
LDLIACRMRTFRCEAYREIVMFFDVSDKSPYLRAAPQHPTPWGTANEKPRHEGRDPP